MAVSTRAPRWYFSLRSPYSWLAYRDLCDRYPDVLDMMRWIPCWDVDEGMREQLAAAGITSHFTPMSRAKNFYILNDVRRLAVARGLPMRWPTDREPRWENCHLAYLVAADHGLHRRFVDAAYRARWEQGRDICDSLTLAEIADEVGLDAQRLVSVGDDPALRDRGFECMAESYRDGVFGVPHFAHGREGYWGIDRLAAFVSAVRGAPESESPEMLWVSDTECGSQWRLAGVEAGHAGGCG